MVFVDAAIAWRDRKLAEAEERGFKQGYRESFEKARATALTEARATALTEILDKAYALGREDAHQTWSDWYARFTDAKARGVPFGEATPAP